MSWLSFLYILKATVPVLVGDTNASEEDLAKKAHELGDQEC